MNKSKKENKGMLIAIIGLLFSGIGMLLLNKEGYENISLGLSALGVLVILIGLIGLFKANRVTK